ncbi:hypothetical protein FB381_4316 [Nocardioides albertanoniae]|uniref:Uncharacterized protein n=1 Tax=Nocardioides albertanoniae TaxID=1175486 RepID=A0A543AD06_9ACTN|nr:hypothetical protein [Nocardioides albertanoniae]TQL70386.1 hypothetical protein FB381_4316 [Nocardioides albertanoniae]
MDKTTLSLIIGSFAALVAVGNVFWNVYSWRHTGARLQVKATSFVFADFLTSDQWFVAIEATNKGRTATTVTALGFEIPKGGVMILTEPAVRIDRLPKRLEPGETVIYPVSPDDVRKAATAQDVDPTACIPYALCGHGRFQGKIDANARDLLVDEPQ